MKEEKRRGMTGKEMEIEIESKEYNKGLIF